MLGLAGERVIKAMYSYFNAYSSHTFTQWLSSWNIRSGWVHLPLLGSHTFDALTMHACTDGEALRASRSARETWCRRSS